jgi:hypothetical protein
VTVNKIGTNAVTELKIATNAVTVDKILNSAVTVNKIADKAVSFAKIQDIQANKILGRGSSIGSVQEIAVSGSGSVVLQNSPTLTNPNLGTPSAINLTNATAVPLTTNKVNGILEVVNGGTGTSNLNGLLKGNGTDSIKTAINGTDYSLVREVEDKFIATTTSQSSFTLSTTPNANSIVKMFINGVKVAKGSFTVTGVAGKTITYTPANNRDVAIAENDIIEFIYYY